MEFYFSKAQDIFDQCSFIDLKDAVYHKRYTFQEALDRGLLEFESGRWLDQEGNPYTVKLRPVMNSLHIYFNTNTNPKDKNEI